MPLLKDLRENTIPVTIRQGEMQFTLQVRANLLTPAVRAQSKSLDDKATDIVRAQEKLRRETYAEISKTREVPNSQTALEGAEPTTEPFYNEEEIQKLSDEFEKKFLKLEAQLFENAAQRIAFYVKRTDITNEDGSAIEPTKDFFRDNFPDELLTHILREIQKALSAPLGVGTGDSSAG